MGDLAINYDAEIATGGLTIHCNNIIIRLTDLLLWEETINKEVLKKFQNYIIVFPKRNCQHQFWLRIIVFLYTATRSLPM